MRRRLAVLLLALVAVFGVSVSAPQPAAAADGIIGGAINGACRIATGPILGTITGTITSPGRAGSITGDGPLCDKVGQVGAKAVSKAWKAVWDSVLGDVINSAADVVRWVIKKVITVALLGPSLDLKATGLFGEKATLAGMLTWLGLVIATFGAMWQIGKMAITGQTKHVGRALLGWVESTILSAVGVGLIALLVTAGDALTSGLVNVVFKDGQAYQRIAMVMVPKGVNNPVTMLCIVAVLALIGFIQLVLIFLRQSAIPIQCLLLPVAGGGRVGGDATRQWAPRLITSICVVIAYKPILAVIICVGFAEFGQAHTLAEWLRGCATLVLAIVAPGPLTRIFAPFGEVVGAGLAAGGVGGALGSAAGYIAGGQGRDGKDGGDGGKGGDADAPTSAVKHAQYVEQSMGPQGGRESEAGGDARAQAARNDSNRVPAQAAPEGAGTGSGTGSAAASGTGGAGAGASASRSAGAGGAAAGGAGIAIQVLDGVNNTVQGASGQIGNGGNQQ
ncbi:hypothetical protein ACFC08_36870 [Streptomyces sp. NPDC056112]|uniref:hypothetical protein n=1 Tax=Streptomyces sp. NPDC056112 TaxID=3345715 RepID=UPI0035D7DCA8